MTLCSWQGDVEVAMLVVSELVTNAINHGYVVGHLLDLRLAILEDGSLLVDVSDPLPDPPDFGAVCFPGEDEERGRGLRLIRELGADLWWFLRQERGGKTVRAHIPAPGTPIRTPARSADSNRCTSRRYAHGSQPAPAPALPVDRAARRTVP
ncbi:ATP-binding protein [Streptomyces beijiangensis]